VIDEFINELDLAVNKFLESKRDQKITGGINENERNNQYSPVIFHQVNDKSDGQSQD
jgi:hypothetical protein